MNQISNDVLHQITSFLSSFDLMQFMSTCKYLGSLSELWKNPYDVLYSLTPYPIPKEVRGVLIHRFQQCHGNLSTITLDLDLESNLSIFVHHNYLIQNIRLCSLFCLRQQQNRLNLVLQLSKLQTLSLRVNYRDSLYIENLILSLPHVSKLSIIIGVGYWLYIPENITRLDGIFTAFRSRPTHFQMLKHVEICHDFFFNHSLMCDIYHTTMEGRYSPSFTSIFKEPVFGKGCETIIIRFIRFSVSQMFDIFTHIKSTYPNLKTLELFLTIESADVHRVRPLITIINESGISTKNCIYYFGSCFQNDMNNRVIDEMLQSFMTKLQEQ